MTDINELPTWSILIFILVMFWGMFWKIIALWTAARKKNKPWFLILFFFNTVGILEMYYLFGVEKIKAKKLFK